MPRRGKDRPLGVIKLSRTGIGVSEDWSLRWPSRIKKRCRASDRRDVDHLILDGLVYDHLVNPSGLSSEHYSREEDRAGTSRVLWLDGQPRHGVAEHIRPQLWVHLSDRLANRAI